MVSCHGRVGLTVSTQNVVHVSGLGVAIFCRVNQEHLEAHAGKAAESTQSGRATADNDDVVIMTVIIPAIATVAVILLDISAAAVILLGISTVTVTLLYILIITIRLFHCDAAFSSNGRRCQRRDDARQQRALQSSCWWKMNITEELSKEGEGERSQ